MPASSLCPVQNKVCYRTELDAKIALFKRSRKDKGEVRHYRCPHCASWHLTSKGGRRK